jgi:hypothetical protein
LLSPDFWAWPLSCPDVISSRLSGTLDIPKTVLATSLALRLRSADGIILLPATAV